MATPCTRPADGLPGHADVLVLRSFTQDDVRARAARFIGLLRGADACPRDHASFSSRADRTVVQLMTRAPCSTTRPVRSTSAPA